MLEAEFPHFRNVELLVCAFKTPRFHPTPVYIANPITSNFPCLTHTFPAAKTVPFVCVKMEAEPAAATADQTPLANAAEEAKKNALRDYRRVLLQHKEADAKVRYPSCNETNAKLFGKQPDFPSY